jgi:hypothetical protein
MFKFILPILLALTTVVTAIPLKANFYNVPPTIAFRRAALPSSYHSHFERKRASALHTLLQEAQPTYAHQPTNTYNYPRRSAIPHASALFTLEPSHSNLAELHARLETLKGMEGSRYREVKRALGRVRTRAAVESVRRWVEDEIFKAAVEASSGMKRRELGEGVFGWY